MDTFTIILDNLTRHGVPDAVERANEIETELNYRPKQHFTGEDILQIALECVVKEYADYPLVKRVVDHKTGVRKFRIITHPEPITIDTIQARSRKREIVVVRQIMAYLLYRHAGLSYKQTGLVLGGFDHSTAIHSVNTVNDLKSYDKGYAHKLMLIEKDFKQRAGIV